MSRAKTEWSTNPLPYGVLGLTPSPDGLWIGAINPNNTGQLTGITVNGINNLYETLFYESSTGGGGFTWRVEQNYNAVSQNIGVNSATFESIRFDGKIRLDTSIVMLDGPSGGALFTMTYTNVGTTVEQFQPFFYADVDADPGFGGDSAQWLPTFDAIEQFDSAALFWIGGAEVYTGWEIDTFPLLYTELDTGVTSLLNTGGGPANDWTGAVSGASVALSPGESVSMVVGVGGEGITGGCYADCDQSTGIGILDIFDFLCFQNSFVAGEAYACDCDTSTGPLICDIFNFLCFQNSFVAGCP